MRRPLVPVVLAFTSGILVGDRFSIPLLWLFAAAIVLLLFSVALPKVRAWLVLPVLFFAGIICIAVNTRPLSPADLRYLCTGEPEMVFITGKLIRTPEIRTYTTPDGSRRVRSIALIDADSIERDGGPISVKGTVIAFFNDKIPYHKGHVLNFQGVLSEPPGPEAPGLFDYSSYLKRQGIYFQVKASPDTLGTKDPDVPVPFEDKFIKWARSILARGLGPEDEALRLLWSMALGWRAAVEAEVYDPFIKTGTMHIFAISGLHIAFVSAILVTVLRALRVPRSICGLIVLPLIWFYTGATGFQPSAVRSTLMMSIIIGGWALSRPVDLINSLFAAAFLILMFDPQQIFGTSFQLSFLVVLSIGLFTPALEGWRDRILKHDPWIPPSLIPPWRRHGMSLLRLSSSAVIVSLAACAGSLPLCAATFHIASPVTLLANVLIVPMSSLALGCNLGSFIFGNWFPPFTEAFNNCAWLLMKAMIWLSDLWVQMPGGYYYVRGFTPLECLLYYAVLVAIGTGWLLRKKIRWYALGSLLVLVSSLYVYDHLTKAPEIIILPAQYGMAVHSSSPNGETLIDCGKSNAVEHVLQPLLRSRGVNFIDYFILTHGDLNHIGGAQLVAEDFHVRRICAGPVSFRSPIYRKLISHFDGLPKGVTRLKLGDQAGDWHVLHPLDGDKFSRADDAPIVLMGTFRGVRVLLVSDLGRDGQEQLVQRIPDLRADIVVTGLSSAGEPLRDELLERISPRLIIIADTDTPPWERARDRTLERLARSGATVITTADCGVTTLKFTREGCIASTVSGTTTLLKPKLYTPMPSLPSRPSEAVTQTMESSDEPSEEPY